MTHTIPRYLKLVPIDFLRYGNTFPQFMGNRREHHICPTHGSGGIFLCYVFTIQKLYELKLFVQGQHKKAMAM